MSNLPKEPELERPKQSFQSSADQFLLQTLAPAAVLVNAKGDILYVNGRTGKYLEPASGKANLNIHAMAREGFRYELDNALNSVARNKGKMVIEGLRVENPGGKSFTFSLSVQAIDKPKELEGVMLVAFHDLPDQAAKRVRSSRKKEDQARNDEAQNLREQMQLTQEELTSANEELQSTNEELQSTNEELTTSKEEMQSLNEELQVVNAELQSKVDNLSWLNSDMRNLLNSTDIATLFLDNALCVRRFTDTATQLFSLIPGDLGRPLSDITNQLNYPSLQEDAHAVLKTLIFSEKEIQASHGRWFRVRIMPYRTVDNVIDGVVITLSDISAFKLLESELRVKQTNPDRKPGKEKP